MMGAIKDKKKGEIKLPVNNFLLIKKIMDDPDNEGSLILVGTVVQFVFDVNDDLGMLRQQQQKEEEEEEKAARNPTANGDKDTNDSGDDKEEDGKELFSFEFRFNDFTAEIGGDYVQLRRKEPLKFKVLEKIAKKKKKKEKDEPNSEERVETIVKPFDENDGDRVEINNPPTFRVDATGAVTSVDSNDESDDKMESDNVEYVTRERECLGVRSTFQVKIPLELESALEMFPFQILEAKVDIELSSTFFDGKRFRPNLLISKVDRRGNTAIQKLNSPKLRMGRTVEEMVDRKIDKSRVYDFISPYPEIHYEYDDKKKYCARQVISYTVIKGGLGKLITIILPMILVSAINTLNVLNDINDEEADIVDVLGVSSALTLTAVFLLPSIIEPTKQSNLMRRDNLYVFIIFFALLLSSFPAGMVGSNVYSYVGMALFWASFLNPAWNVRRFIRYQNAIRELTAGLVPDKTYEYYVPGVLERGPEAMAVHEEAKKKEEEAKRKKEAEDKKEGKREVEIYSADRRGVGEDTRNPFLVEPDYKTWKKDMPYNNYFATVDEMLGLENVENAKSSGYRDISKPNGKFKVVTYRKISNEINRRSLFRSKSSIFGDE